jgi:hypothetical protein
MNDRTRPAPMTADTAREIVAEMLRDTSKRARIAMLRMALVHHDHLSDEARAVYAAQLAAEERA